MDGAGAGGTGGTVGGNANAGGLTTYSVVAQRTGAYAPKKLLKAAIPTGALKPKVKVVKTPERGDKVVKRLRPGVALVKAVSSTGALKPRARVVKAMGY